MHLLMSDETPDISGIRCVIPTNGSELRSLSPRSRGDDDYSKAAAVDNTGTGGWAKISEKRSRAREQTCRFINRRHRAGWRAPSGRKRNAHGAHFEPKVGPQSARFSDSHPTTHYLHTLLRLRRLAAALSEFWVLVQ